MTSTANKLRAYADSESGWQDIDDLCRLAARELDIANNKIARYEYALNFIVENAKRPNLWYASIASIVLHGAGKETKCPTQTNS